MELGLWNAESRPRLNTAMHDNLQALANLLLANFYTIRFRRLGPEWDWQEPLSDSDHRRVEKGMRIDRLISDIHRHRIRRSAVGCWSYAVP